MKVILTTNIKKLGKIGDLVEVKNGYARNFLFPNNMALRNSEFRLSTDNLGVIFRIILLQARLRE